MQLACQGKISLENDSAVTNAITIENKHFDGNNDLCNALHGGDTTSNEDILLKKEDSSNAHDCMSIITFTDEDLLLGSKSHNHLLFVAGYTPKLPCLWLPVRNENAVVPSQLHQCFKYCRNSIVKKVFGDNKPFIEAESHFADAKYYIEDTKKKTERVNNNYVAEGFSSTENHKREENLREFVFNSLSPHRKILHGIANRQSVFDSANHDIHASKSDDENDRKSVASSNYISNSAEEDIAQTYHITLIEDGEVEEKDIEDALVELEDSVKPPLMNGKKCVCMALQRNTRVRPKGEVNKLIEVGFIREVKYPMWISSIVSVRKKNGQIRLCIDFRDLNNACLKDDFLLSIVELMIDATTGNEALSFMDGSFGYNQIHMALDE
ncbi:UNVERIFIED_CONTAM: hypothetical protein Scaly_2774600 [Sesamum calycinum]|uniref:Reverse transcriptase n=1 Tax=Sesamum calycinum TaxID=2727403 RepID=A0AAW2IXZ5_9LAMI